MNKLCKSTVSRHSVKRPTGHGTCL
jgi:hypothetical protein